MQAVVEVEAVEAVVEVETGGGAKEPQESGYEKRDSSPSPRILLLQDIDILTGTPGRPCYPGPPGPPGHFHD